MCDSVKIESMVIRTVSCTIFSCTQVQLSIEVPPIATGDSTSSAKECGIHTPLHDSVWQLGQHLSAHAYDSGYVKDTGMVASAAQAWCMLASMSKTH